MFTKDQQEISQTVIRYPGMGYVMELHSTVTETCLHADALRIPGQ
jgi:hypothetical protein